MLNLFHHLPLGLFLLLPFAVILAYRNLVTWTAKKRRAPKRSAAFAKKRIILFVAENGI